MSDLPNFGVTIRGLILDEGELFMVKHDPKATYYALPGGHLEPGESLEAGLARELLEETGVQAEIGPLIFINEWLGRTQHRLEFFFWVNNAEAFRQADPTTASHGFEIASFTFGEATNAQYGLLPRFLQTKFPELVAQGARYPTELIRSI